MTVQGPVRRRRAPFAAVKAKWVSLKNFFFGEDAELQGTGDHHRVELDDVLMTPNGARPQVILLLSRPLTEYEARVVWDFFPLASASEGSKKIRLHTGHTPFTRARLNKDVARISKHAVALERQHQRTFAKFQAAAKAKYRAAAKAVKKPLA